ncbi:MAG: DUF4249 domain-containing protein [Labilibaculum sp.]|nr:DUF4249 domain-containing protein [Labilibaculum sp.]
MKRITINIQKVYLLSFFILLMSCETDVTNDIDLPAAPKRLVIEGGVERNRENLNQKQKIRLTTTANYLSDENVEVIKDATVVITDGLTTYDLVYTADGYYETDELTPKINKEYKISINWKGEVYEGSDKLNEVPSFDRFYYEFEEETIFTDEGYFIKFDCTDPAGVENYYYYRIFVNGVFTIVPDPGNNMTLVESDEFFDGQKRIGINPNEEVSFVPGEIATAQQLGISKAYYKYLYQLFVQTGNQGMSFVGNPPPASIRSNIVNLTNKDNRPLGYFYATDVVTDTILIEELK